MSKPAWKKFEEDTGTYLKKRCETEPMIYHPFYDTYSAEGLLPAQPGDHFVMAPAGGILLETKYSSVHSSLRACFSGMVSNTQIAMHRLWLRAGAYTFFMFKGTEHIELWEGGHCAWCRLSSKRLDPEYIVSQGETIEETLSDVWVGFPKTELRRKIL